MKRQLLDYYLIQLGIENIPDFLIKYLEVPSLLRLKEITYFCGMDKASTDIYDFAEDISRYDHSLSVALLTYKMSHDKKTTIAALFHDVATPCFSHVIDYMNKDYEKQESTEEYTEIILKNDEYLLKLLKQDNIDIEEITNFKKYTIVDNDRPKVCADRIDGVILTGIGWTKNVNKKDIYNIVNDLKIYENEEHELEIGFTNKNVAKRVLEISESIDIVCHSNEDNYMMELLAEITRLSIKNEYIIYNDLYYLNEKELFDILENKKQNDKKLKELLYEFKNIKLNEIPQTKMYNVKIRDLNPIANNKRIKCNQ